MGAMLPKPNPDVVHRRLDDDVVLVNMTTNQIYALNTTGARFWDLLAGGSTREEIVASLEAEFDVEPHQIEREIDGLLDELERAGIVRAA